MVRVAVSSGDPIPLTLTLSHGEREQAAAGLVLREDSRADPAFGCADSQRMVWQLRMYLVGWLTKEAAISTSKKWIAGAAGRKAQKK